MDLHDQGKFLWDNANSCNRHKIESVLPWGDVAEVLAAYRDGEESGFYTGTEADGAALYKTSDGGYAVVHEGEDYTGHG